jgi:creatinine amidohydrolase
LGIVPRKLDLGLLSSERFADLVAGSRDVVVMLPVGVVEPHGPHLPLETDTLISLGACARAASTLTDEGFEPLIAPALPYGVTRYASAFKGTVSVDGPTLAAYLRCVIEAFLRDGVSHVCLVNNHLEPEHVDILRDVIVGFASDKASLACPLEKRWARTLSDEFRSGACHAGRYETSIVMALRPELVDDDARRLLPDVPISLSEKIRAGLTDFAAMGLARSYAGSPATADAGHGEEQLERLATMIVTVVLEARGRSTPGPP